MRSTAEHSALSLMDNEKYKNGYEPFLQNCISTEFNNPQQLRETVSEQTCAVILEFIQGEGGVRPLTQEFVDEIKRLKEKFGFLLIADEIQAGLGRTGKVFSFEHFHIQPDVVVVAKPLGGGLPLGAILSNDEVAETFTPGVHGTTFGGNPVACSAGLAALREIFGNGIMQNADTVGFFFTSELLKLKEEFPSLIKEIRGIGLMLGIELSFDGERIVTAMREKQILINCTAQTVLRFLPPLIIRQEHVAETITALRQIFSTIKQA